MRRTDAGLSLTELLIVILIVTILVVLAVPTAMRTIASYRLHSSANLVASELGKARSMAISGSLALELLTDSSADRLQIVDPSDEQSPPRAERSLDGGIHFGSTPPQAIRFFPRGNARGGSLELRDEFAQRIVITVHASGLVDVGEVEAVGE